MFVEGNELAAKVGRENVYDFSLGNPATPAPAALNEAIKQLVDETDPLVLHGYMDNAGYPDVRQAVAENLNKRFGTAFTSHNIVMTVGAAGGLNIIFKTILDPGDEVIVFAPYFGEYKSYAANFDAEVVEVAPDFETFQPDLMAFEKAINEKTKAADNCNFCLDSRLKKNQTPGCVESCKYDALIFGDASDEKSYVSRLLKVKDSVRIKPELGTDPVLRYIPIVKLGV